MHFPFTLMSGAADSTGLVRDLLIILGAAALISIMLRRLHIAAIPGYLIVGAILGSLPGGMIKDPANVEQISNIAIILLMFTIGLHLDMESIRSGMASILLVGLISTLAVALVLWPIGMAFGLSAPGALVMAMALSMSSTAVSIGILQKNKEVHLTHGRICVGVAIVQDLLCIPLLGLMPAIAVWAGAGLHAGEVAGIEPAVSDSGTSRGLQLVSDASLAIGGIIAMLAFAKYLLPKILREASWGGNTEALLVISAGTGLCAAALTNYLGFGSALGAFLAGFMLSSTPFRYQLAGQLSPMRDLFMAVFFTAVGIKLNVPAVLQMWWIVLLAVILTMALKTWIIAFTTWAGGATATVSAMVALILCQAGEFSLVVLDEAEKKHIVSSDAHAAIIALVVISLVLTTPISDYGRTFVPRLSKIRPARWITNPALRDNRASAGAAHSAAHADSQTEGAPPKPPTPHKERPVIIAGFGIVGRNLAEHFAARNIPYHIVDLNPSTVVRQNQLGRRTVFGDIANPDVLESAGIHEAEAVALTIPDDEATLRACRSIRAIRSDIFIAARTSFLSRAIAAHEVGADHVTIEEVVTAQAMAVAVVEELGKRYISAEEVPHL